MIKKIINRLKYERTKYIQKHMIETIKYKEKAKINESIYVIRRYPGAGFFSDFFYVVSHMQYALEKYNNVNIVVDMENYPTLYKEIDSINGTKNQWEYYFKQPNDVTVSMLNDYERLIFSKHGFIPGKTPLYAGVGENKMFPSREIVRNLNEKILPMIPFSKNVELFLENGVNSLKNKKIIGIHIRATDMIQDESHPTPYSIKDLFLFIEQNNILNKYDYFFVCSDDQEIIDDVKLKFGDIVITNDALRATDNKEEGIHKQKNERKHNRYLMGLEVIRDMMCLATCDSLICAPSNVAYAAIVYNNNKYSHVYIWENGCFLDRI